MSEPQVPEGVASELALENEHHVQGAEQGPPEQGPPAQGPPRAAERAHSRGTRGITAAEQLRGAGAREARSRTAKPAASTPRRVFLLETLC